MGLVRVLISEDQRGERLSSTHQDRSRLLPVRAALVRVCQRAGVCVFAFVKGFYLQIIIITIINNNIRLVSCSLQEFLCRSLSKASQVSCWGQRFGPTPNISEVGINASFVRLCSHGPDRSRLHYFWEVFRELHIAGRRALHGRDFLLKHPHL